MFASYLILSNSSSTNKHNKYIHSNKLIAPYRRPHLLQVSGFHSGIVEVFAFLRCYATYICVGNWRFGTTYRSNLQGSNILQPPDCFASYRRIVLTKLAHLPSLITAYHFRSLKYQYLVSLCAISPCSCEYLWKIQMCCVWVGEAWQAAKALVWFPGYFIDFGHGVDLACNRNEYQEYLQGSKGGRCVGPLLHVDCLAILGAKPPTALRACPGWYRDCFLLFICMTNRFRS
jgi:hypothetical protein